MPMAQPTMNAVQYQSEIIVKLKNSEIQVV